MSCTLMLLKFTHEATTLDYIEDDEGYAKKTKAAAPRRKTNVPRHRVMLQVFQRPRQNYTIAGRDMGHNTWLESPSSLVSNATNDTSFGLPSMDK